MSNGAPTRADLSFRARRILYAVVTEYIATGEPVGSRKLSRRYGLNLSPASIRNVLADLEEAGYLSQPHTSAGRVPTDLGFRVFVDALVQMREVTAEDRAAILGRLKSIRGSDDLLRESSRLLSTMTGAAAVVTLPRPDQERLAQLRFVPLGDQRLLAVVVTKSGAVQNRVVPFSGAVDPKELERIHNYLDELVGGRSLREVRDSLAEEMENERGRYDQLRRRVRDMVQAMSEADSDRAEVLIEGQGRLFDRPEFMDVEKIKGYLRTFEERASLLTLLDQTLAAGGVQVLIGSEANLEDLQDISVISANYGGEGSASGILGIIGPTRMDYAKCVPLVGYTAQVMTEVLNGNRDDD